MRLFIRAIRIFFGAEICPMCGSKNIVQRGYEGINHRHDCKDCGTTTHIESWLQV